MTIFSNLTKGVKLRRNSVVLVLNKTDYGQNFNSVKCNYLKVVQTIGVKSTVRHPILFLFCTTDRRYCTNNIYYYLYSVFLSYLGGRAMYRPICCLLRIALFLTKTYMYDTSWRYPIFRPIEY